MDQLKDFLRQCIKYRFWIAVSVAALLSMIGYAVGSGPVKKAAEDQTNAIKTADTDAKKYSSGVVPNAQYKPLVDKAKDTLSRDVRISHQKLYARQAPLLTWPKTVEERFQTWGRKWPENVDAQPVQVAIIDYVQAYPKFVDQVYQTFHPFDPAEGKGVVAAPPEHMLLKPAAFTMEHPPELGKVWAAQERLWIQRTLLQVVADVNRDAKDWSTAIIKQINLLEVGNATAQDQLSLSKGEPLEPAPPLSPPGVAAAPVTAPTDPNAPAVAVTSQDPDEVYYIKSPSPNQYKILPVQMSVLIEQDHIQDFLVALENSPMAIQVVDFEMAKPPTPVTRPQKGDNMNNYYGGENSMMPTLPGRGPMPSNIRIIRPITPGGTSARKKTGTDIRNMSPAERLKAEQEKAEQTAAVTIHDPYYYIVEVTIYGQARFYTPPPPEPAAEPSQAAAPPAEIPKTEGTAPAPAPSPTPEQPKTEGTAPAPTTEQPKPEPAAPKDEPAAPKAEPSATPPVTPEGAAKP